MRNAFIVTMARNAAQTLAGNGGVRAAGVKGSVGTHDPEFGGCACARKAARRMAVP